MVGTADAPQRREALDVGQSFIVQAPAGSGKTELLTQRYLALLSTVQRPEEIIAITFTRKAASEMRQRILQALQKAQQGMKPTSSHGEQTHGLAQAALTHSNIKGWHLLENPQRLSIYTIDALCGQLVRHMPILSRFGIQPAVTEDPETHYEQAVTYLLESLEKQQPWSTAMATLYRHLDNNEASLYGLLMNMLAHREQWLPHTVHKSYKPLRERMEEGLHRLSEYYLQQISALRSTFPYSLLKELMEASAQCLKVSWTDEHNYWRFVSQTLLTAKGQWRKSVTKKQGFPTNEKLLKQQMLAVIDALRDNHPLREALVHFKQLPPTTYEESHWAMVDSLLTLLPVLTAQLQLVFQEAGEIDFQEMAQGALRALGSPENPTDLALYYDHRIQHLLVDEFQDTSLSQYTFLKQLTAGWQRDDGRTLFFVGDPMQSIYRFRQAEVGLFLRVKNEGLGEKQCRFISLSSNFRSSPPLVDWFNGHFHAIFPSVEDQELGAIPYSPSVAHNKKSEQGSTVHWHFSATGKKEAHHMASTIENLRCQHPQYTLAILVRARSHLHPIIEALNEKNIPYTGVGLLSLWDIRAVRDIVALFRALHHHADRLSWLSVLRAPYVGLTLSDLHRLSHTTDGQTLWHGVENYDNHWQLSEDAKQRLARIVPVIQKSMALQYQKPVDQWLKETWMALGGADTISPQASIAMNTFFNVLQQYSLKPWGKSGDTLARLCQRTTLSHSTHHGNPIHIMTIHKAKGLEFDGVFIPQLQRRTHYDRLPLLHWYERPTHGGSDLLISSYKKHREQWPLYEYIHSLHKKKGHYEAQRLFYVACTRAKHTLYLSGELTYDDEGEIQLPPKHSFLHTLWQHALPHVIHAELETDLTEKEIEAPVPLYRLPRDWQLPTDLTVNASTPAPEKSKPLSMVVSHEEKILGIFYHELLQHMAESPHYSPLENPWHWQVRLQQLGGSKESLPQLIHAIETSLPLVLKDPKAQWILKPTHESAACEYPLQYFRKDKLAHIIVDRTFIDNGLRWIIDYKVTTGAINPRIYYEQLQHYGRRWHEYEKMPVALGIYFPLQQRFEEVTL